VAEPRALLLDEPFAALDASLRVRLREELRELQSRLGLPILLITHDEADVAAFADDVVRIADGRTVSDDPTEDPDHSMKISARNQLSGRVSVVASGTVNDEIELTLTAGQKIVAVVTRQSATSLGLVPGAEAFALVKASSVLLATDLGGARLSARNQLRGTVTRLQPGAVNAEVLIDVGGGRRWPRSSPRKAPARSGWRPAPRCSPCSRPRASSSACRASGPAARGRPLLHQAEQGRRCRRRRPRRRAPRSAGSAAPGLRPTR
jgi:molybdopterin-binding protein